MLTWIACIMGAYLVGSIPFGFLIGRAQGIDIRQHGSKNVGATNVGRVLGKKAGGLCFGLDVLKGAMPVLVAGFAAGLIRKPAPGDIAAVDMWWWMGVAAAAVIGHMLPLFLRFVGGKGVATAFGALVAMWPLLTLPSLAAFAVWFGVLVLFRYVSLASMLAAVSLPAWYVVRVLAGGGDDPAAALTHASPPFVTTVLLATLVVYRHRTNIGRLRRGEEPKIREKK